MSLGLAPMNGRRRVRRFSVGRKQAGVTILLVSSTSSGRASRSPTTRIVLRPKGEGSPWSGAAAEPRQAEVGLDATSAAKQI